MKFFHGIRSFFFGDKLKLDQDKGSDNNVNEIGQVIANEVRMDIERTIEATIKSIAASSEFSNLAKGYITPIDNDKLVRKTDNESYVSKADFEKMLSTHNRTMMNEIRHLLNSDPIAKTSINSN